MTATFQPKYCETGLKQIFGVKLLISMFVSPNCYQCPIFNNTLLWAALKSCKAKTVLRWAFSIPQNILQKFVFLFVLTMETQQTTLDGQVGVYIHYENMPMQHTEIFKVVKLKIFSSKNLIFFLFLLKT